MLFHRLQCNNYSEKVKACSWAINYLSVPASLCSTPTVRQETGILPVLCQPQLRMTLQSGLLLMEPPLFAREGFMDRLAAFPCCTTYNPAMAKHAYRPMPSSSPLPTTKDEATKPKQNPTAGNRHLGSRVSRLPRWCRGAEEAGRAMAEKGKVLLPGSACSEKEYRHVACM